MTVAQMGIGATGRSNRRRLKMLLLLAVLGICWVLLPDINGHAQDRHGSHAVSAYKYVSDYDPNNNDGEDDERWFMFTQGDGRTIHTLRLPELAGKPTTWATVITGGGVLGGTFLVTCFLTQDRKRVKRDLNTSRQQRRRR